MGKKIIFIAVSLFFQTLTVLAQNFPVQVSTTVLPPYSLYLSDYTTSDKIAVNILFDDPVRVELPVRLKLTIEGQGITITTKPDFRPEPIYLQVGFAERLTGADIAPYFDARNLIFQGLDRRQFEKTGALPEGVYRFCIEVWEHTQNKKVSNSGCSVVWMILNDPPIINYPANGEKIKIQDPQLVVFNWTPRHTGSPNAAFSTAYDFELVEVRSNDRNANNAMLTSPPIFTTTTQSTSVYYSMAETPLIAGQQYAFRVRAKAQSGLDELDMFKNKGYSEVFTFTYGDYCLNPDAVKFTTPGPTSIHGTWTSLPSHTSFTMRYKENKQDAAWFEKTSMVSEGKIGSLRGDTEYLIQVLGHCGVVGNENINTYTVKTRAAEENNFVCNAPPAGVKFDNAALINSLTPGDFIKSANFKIGLTEVIANGNGTFKGRGVAYIPWLKLAGVKVEFKNIKVNADRNVIEGDVVSVQSANSDWVWTAPGTSDKDNTSDDTNGSINETPTDDFPIVIIEGTIATVTKNAEGHVVVTDTKGNVMVVKEDKVVIKDSVGNSYTVDGDTIKKTGEGGDSLNGNNGGPPTALIPEASDKLKKALALLKDENRSVKIGVLDIEVTSKRQSVALWKTAGVQLSKAASNESATMVLMHSSDINYTNSNYPPTPLSPDYKAYREKELAFNKAMFIDIVTRESISSEELDLIGDELVIENLKLNKFIEAKKASSTSDENVIASIKKAIDEMIEAKIFGVN